MNAGLDGRDQRFVRQGGDPGRMKISERCLLKGSLVPRVRGYIDADDRGMAKGKERCSQRASLKREWGEKKRKAMSASQGRGEILFPGKGAEAVPG